MSILDNECILVNDDNPIIIHNTTETVKYLSYGFWNKVIFTPALNKIESGNCDLNIYVAHPNFNEFQSYLYKIYPKTNIIDCATLNNLSGLAVFIQRLPEKGIILIGNPSLLPDNSIKENIKNILFNCWKDETIKVEKLLKENNADKYIINNGNKILHRGNYGIIYLDYEKNKNFNFKTSAETECYGNFFLANNNFTFINYFSDFSIIKSNPDDDNSIILNWIDDGKKIFKQ